MAKLKIVSLVPSWTETLLTAEANVVGRTRFCVHPQGLVELCPQVGGTKDLNVPKLIELNPDYVIMDKEENTQEMASLCPFKILSSHVRSLRDLHAELINFSTILNLPLLKQYGERVQQVMEMKKKPLARHRFPGMIEWWTRPPERNLEDYHIVYIIWKNPYMCVTSATYIGSMLEQLGLNGQLWAPQGLGLYPEFKLQDLPPKCLLLFSSEPYPFAGFKKDYVSLSANHHAGLVDGESFSWFGIRSLCFLEKELFG